MLQEQNLLGSNFRCLVARYGKQSAGRAIARISLLTACFVLAGGCAASEDEAVTVSMDQNFELRAGGSAQVEGAEIEIGFQVVTSDSRCGKGEQCITEGDAAVRIWLVHASGTREEGVLHTGSRMASAVDFANFSVGLVALHPAAISGRVIEPKNYIATFRVTRGISGGRLIY